MSTTIYSVDSLPSRIALGRQTENGARQVKIDCQSWLAQWPGLSIDIWVTPPGGAEAYPANATLDGDILVWTISNADTATAGDGTMEVAGLLDGIKILSAVAATYVSATTTASTGEPPEAYQGWVDQVLAAGAEARQSASEAEASAADAAKSAQQAHDEVQTAISATSAAGTYMGRAENAAKEAEASAKTAEENYLLTVQHAGEADSAADSAGASFAQATVEASKAATSATEAAASAQEASSYVDAAQAIADSIPDDYSTLTEQVAQNTADLLNKADIITCEASGALVSVTDAAARPAVGVVSSIAPLQAGDGTPTPDNIRAISGHDQVNLSRTGRNMLLLNDSSATRGGVTVTAGQQGLLTFSGTSTLSSTGTVNLATMTLPAGAYTLSGTVAGGSLTSNSEGVTVAFINVGGTYYRVRKNDLEVSFTLTQQQAVTIGCMVAANGAVYDDYVVQLQMECGSEATAWQPCEAQRLTVALPETVYGGTINWLTGELTVDRMLVSFDGTENWKKNTTSANTVRLTTPSGAASIAVASHYLVRSTSNSANDMSTIIGTQLNVRDSVHAVDVATWTAYLAAQAAAGTPFHIVCTTKELRTLTLDPQQLDVLKGTNHLWTDTGETGVTYKADTKLYIDDKFAELQNAILAQGANI